MKVISADDQALVCARALLNNLLKDVARAAVLSAYDVGSVRPDQVIELSVTEGLRMPDLVDFWHVGTSARQDLKTNGRAERIAFVEGQVTCTQVIGSEANVLQVGYLPSQPHVF